MTDRVVRTLEPAELRAANALFAESLHIPPPGDDDWPGASRAHQPGRTLGVLDDDVLVGTARSADVTMTVPGGGEVDVAAVTGVGVRAGRTRRGVLRDLMRSQFDEFVDRGVPCAALHASEAVIYGRFGYGVATTARAIRVERSRAQVRAEAPTGGEIEVLDLDRAVRELPGLYPQVKALRPGMISRPSFLWPAWEGHYRRSKGVTRGVLHRGGAGVDGYAMYRVRRSGDDGPVVMQVEDMVAATDEAFADLWRFLLGIDLVDRIEAQSRPSDESVPLLLTDPRACSTWWEGDDLWVRLLDVRAALSARRFHGEGRVVIEVSDPLLPANSGRYALSREGVIDTDEPPQLRAGVDAVAMMYLGTWRASSLVGAGFVEVVDPAAVAVAERLLATDVPAWCGTFF